MMNIKEKIKKGMTTLLAVSMMLSLVPIPAFATTENPEYTGTDAAAVSTESYQIFLGDTQVTSENAADVLSDGTVSYDAGTNTITLNSVNLELDMDCGLSAGQDLNLNLVGENSISSKGTSYTNAAVRVQGKLTISGTGSLSLASDPSTNQNAYGIYCTALEIRSGTVNATAYAGSESNGYAVWADGSIVITGGTLNTLVKSGYHKYDIFAYSMTISGGYVQTDSRKADPDIKIYSNADSTVTPAMPTVTSGAYLSDGTTVKLYSQLYRWDAADGKWICNDDTQHTGGSATCIAGAVCDFCGKTYTDPNPDAHTNVVDNECKDCGYSTSKISLTQGGNTTYYGDLLTAVAALNNGEATITLLAPVALEENLLISVGDVTLDLNGFTLDLGDKYLQANTYAALTIQDSSEIGNGYLKGSEIWGQDVPVTAMSGSMDHVNVVSNAFTMSGGTLENGLELSGSTAEISGGIIHGFDYNGHNTSILTANSNVRIIGDAVLDGDYLAHLFLNVTLDLTGWSEDFDGQKIYLESDYEDIYSCVKLPTGVMLSMGDTPLRRGDSAPADSTLTIHTCTNHTGGTATCTEQAKCEICGAWYGEPDENNHDFVDGECECGAQSVVIIRQPETAVAEIGEKFVITVEAEGDGLSYQWYYKDKGMQDFDLSVVKQATYSFEMVNFRVGREYYCVITDRYGNAVQTNTVKSTTGLKIVGQPQDVEVAIGEKATITVGAVGEGLTYQWYYKNRNGKEFAASSYKSKTYSVTMSDSNHGRQVYCVITDAYGNSVTTEVATMTRPPVKLEIVSEPQDVVVENGKTATITVEAKGDGLTYQWYYKNRNGKEFAASSYKGRTYSVTMSDSNHYREVYCVITDQYGNSVTTRTARMSHPPVELKLVSQPEDAYAKMGEKFTITVEAQGDGLTYQWYYKDPGMTDFDVSAVKKATYSFEMVNFRNGRLYYCVITDMYGNRVTTDVVGSYLAEN